MLQSTSKALQGQLNDSYFLRQTTRERFTDLAPFFFSILFCTITGLRLSFRMNRLRIFVSSRIACLHVIRSVTFEKSFQGASSF